jgi:pimeloyl-ACP methyl ester carboxylesterase
MMETKSLPTLSEVLPGEYKSLGSEQGRISGAEGGMMKRALVVFAAKLDTPVHHYRPLLTELRKEPELDETSAEFLLFDRTTHRSGLRRLASFADELAAKINQCWVTHGGFEEVILFGHSIGGLLMREAYLLAWGELPEPRFAWARAVRRIVLLAAPNRGISTLRPIDWLGDRLAQLFLPWMHFTYQDSMEGSTFITNLRLRWIRRFRAHTSDPGALPLVLQMRGTNDNIVREKDSTDVLAFPQGQQIPVPGADHGSIALLSVHRGANGGPELTAEGCERYALLRNALLRGPEALGLAIPESTDPAMPAAASDCVIFILHGIRARNIETWLQNLAQEISKRNPRSTPVRPSYGYFSALRFVLPSVRRRNIRWLQDEYAQRLAENPRATFHFIGHSNGTYMLGESLKKIPAMRFERVVLAGSVLPTDFFAAGKVVRDQVRAVRSDGACFDWPVGILCRVLRNTLQMKDLGTAGYDGFSGSFVTDYRFHSGGHGDMFTAENVRSIVDFVLGDLPTSAPAPMLEENPRFGFVSRLLPKLVGLVLIGLVFFPAFPGVGVSGLSWSIGLVAGLGLAAGVLDAL